MPACTCDGTPYFIGNSSLNLTTSNDFVYLLGGRKGPDVFALEMPPSRLLRASRLLREPIVSCCRVLIRSFVPILV